jgi:hypothetical protein
VGVKGNEVKNKQIYQVNGKIIDKILELEKQLSIINDWTLYEFFLCVLIPLLCLFRYKYLVIDNDRITWEIPAVKMIFDPFYFMSEF